MKLARFLITYTVAGRTYHITMPGLSASHVWREWDRPKSTLVDVVECDRHGVAEYRAAACAVLASALWDYYRANIPPETEKKGDKLRAKFRRMFGDSIASRWFN